MRISLTKLSPNVNKHPVIEGEIFGLPEVGKCFILKYDNELKWFQTSVVTELIDDHTFKTTNNNIYKFQFIHEKIKTPIEKIEPIVEEKQKEPDYFWCPSCGNVQYLSGMCSICSKPVNARWVKKL